MAYTAVNNVFSEPHANKSLEISENCSLTRADLTGYEAASNLAFNDKIKELIKQGEKIYHFGFGQSPFPVPEVLVDGLKTHSNHHEYLSVAGLIELREKILDFHRIYDDLHHFDVNSIILGAGSKELIFLVACIFGGDFLLASPAWTTYYPQCKLARRNVHIIPSYYEDRFLITPEELEKVVQAKCPAEMYKMLILNSPNNPTGISYTSDWIKKLVQVCRKHKILVLSDEIYARLNFEGKHESIANSYPEGTIVTSGFSKWASAGGWRAGYAMFPRELHQLYKAVANAGSHTFTCCPSPVQYALNDGFDHREELHNYILHTRKILKAVGHSVSRKLNEAGAKSLTPEGGYYFMPDFSVCKHGLQSNGIHTGQQMCDSILKEAKVALMPTDPHFLQPTGELSVRFCYVNFDGTTALHESQKRGLQAEIDNEFLQKYCAPTLNGTEAVITWMNRYK